MAYREFDPTKIDDYKESTIRMFNEQNQFATDKITALTTKISDLTTKISDLEIKISNLDSKISSLTRSNNKDGDNDSAISEAESERATAISDKNDAEEEKTKAENAKTALEKVQTDIADAIAQTNKFVNDLKDNIDSSDARFEQNFNNLISQINAYKHNMKFIYETVDTTLRQHGYNKDINLKSQFADTVDDFGDSAMLETFPYIPSRYIYRANTLNERILNGIFKQNIYDVSNEQTNQLSKVIDGLLARKDLNNLGKFISTGYVFDKETYDTGGTKYLNYEFSEIYKKLSINYYTDTTKDIINSVISGKSLHSLSDVQKEKLQIGALLLSFLSQKPSISVPEIEYRLSSFAKIDCDAFKISLKESSRGDFSGIEASMEGPLFGKDNWFVADYIPNLGERLPNFQSAVSGKEKADFKITFLNDLTNKLIDMGKDKSIGALPAGVGWAYDGYSFLTDENDKRNNINETIDYATLNSLFTKIKHGGILIAGKDHKIILGNNFMELNGSQGFGVSYEAYKQQKGINDNTSGSACYSSYYTEYTGCFPIDNNINNVYNWLTAKDTSGRYNDGYGTTYRNDYASAIISVGGKYGIDISMDTGSYQDYKNVIDSYPEEVETVFKELNKNAK